MYTFDGGCELDCTLATGDNYRGTPDNRVCTTCAPGMTIDTLRYPDDFCWRDCYN